MTWLIGALLMGVLIAMLEAFFGKQFLEMAGDLLDWVLVFLFTPLYKYKLKINK